MSRPRLPRLLQGMACALALTGLLDRGTAGAVVIGVVGDFGSAAEGAAKASNELAVANLIKRWNPDFIITLGDNNYPSGSATTIDVNIGQFYHEYIHPYTGRYGAGAVSNRFFPCLGNHDWDTSNGRPSLDYFALPGNERYYSHRQGPVEVFALNSNADPDGTSSSSVQGQWLRNRLTASTARWKLVYLHHPPYSSVAGAGTPAFRWPYASWGASAVFSGHEHIYARIQTNGLPYFINGLGGDEIHGFGGSLAPGTAARYNADYGAMRVEATESNLVIHFISRNNGVADALVLGDPISLPFILAPPISQLVPAGRTVTFNVHATGPSPLRYQWQSNSVNIPSATSSALVIGNVQAVHEGEYAVVVSSSNASVRSASARLELLRHPLITSHPQSQTVSRGGMVTFRVGAEGSGILRYQWRLNDADLPGATSATLVLTNVQLEMMGDYSARVTDNSGSALSAPARLTVLARPLVTQSPVGQTVAVGETVVLSAAANGTLPMNFSWRRNGFVVTNILLNQSTCFWTLRNVQSTNAGYYQVGITNLAGPAAGLTPPAWLTVLEDRDADRLPDAWELAHGLNPDDVGDAANDADADGTNNLQEYLAGTDPNARADLLRIESISPLPGGQWRIAFPAASNRTFGVEVCDEVLTGNGPWDLLADFPAAPTNRLLEAIDSAPTVGRRERFYRVVTPRLTLP